MKGRHFCLAPGPVAVEIEAALFLTKVTGLVAAALMDYVQRCMAMARLPASATEPVWTSAPATSTGITAPESCSVALSHMPLMGTSLIEGPAGASAPSTLHPHLSALSGMVPATASMAPAVASMAPLPATSGYSLAGIAPAAPAALAAPSATTATGAPTAPGAAQAQPDVAQLAEYARYVAAVQLQYAAVAAQYGSGTSGGRQASSVTGTRDGGPCMGHDPNRRFVGEVFKWDDEQGWGFISCFEARKVYGKDVFIHKAEVGGVADLYRQRTKVEVRNTTKVSFAVEISRGKPRARDVEIIDPGVRHSSRGSGGGSSGGSGGGSGGGSAGGNGGGSGAGNSSGELHSTATKNERENDSSERSAKRHRARED